MNDLHTLQQQMRTWEALKEQESAIQNKIDTMERLLPQLQEEMHQEQDDVTNLENGGIVSMFYSVLGRQEEKLDKERQEARAAEIKYQDALQTCQNLYRELEAVRGQINTLGDCAQRYQAALREKQEAFKNGIGSTAAQYQALMQEAAQCQAMQKEIQEALDAGHQVLNQISDIEDALKSASNWGVADMLGGGFVTDMFKYSRLDDAQKQMNELNRLLRMYSKELKDLDVDLHLSANIGSGMQFADFFFDNIFTDAMAFDRINKLRDQVRDIRRQVEFYRDMLYQRQRRNADSLKDLKRQAEDLLFNA